MAAPRAIQSLTISFGLVSIPVKVYTAASSLTVHFNMLARETKSRVRQQLVDASTDQVIDRKDTLKGYEYSKDRYVIFEEEELKRLEAEKSSSLDITEFVPAQGVDPVYFEKGYYLGPDKGGHKAYHLLTGAMARNRCVAVGQYTSRGKEQLSLLRPYKAGLLLQQLYYADEVRAFDDVDVGDVPAYKPGEAELADQLVAQLMSERFVPEHYKDHFRTRVLEAVEKKVAGEQLVVEAAAPRAEIIDLFDALKASLAEGKPVSGRSESLPEATRPSRAAAQDAGPARPRGPAKGLKKAGTKTPAQNPTRAKKHSG